MIKLFKFRGVKTNDDKFNQVILKILLDTRDLTTLSDTIISSINSTILDNFLKESLQSQRPNEQYYSLFNRLGRIKYKSIDTILNLNMLFLLPCVHSIRSIRAIKKRAVTYFDIIPIIQAYCDYGTLDDTILKIYDKIFYHTTVSESYGPNTFYCDNLCKSLFDVIGYDNKVLANALHKKYDLSRELKLKCLENEINVFNDDEVYGDVIIHYLDNSKIKSLDIFNNFESIMNTIESLANCGNKYFINIKSKIEKSCLTNANNLNYYKSDDYNFITTCMSNTVVPMRSLSWVGKVNISENLLNDFIYRGGDVSTIPHHRLSDNILNYVIRVNPLNATKIPVSILNRIKLRPDIFDILIRCEECLTLYSQNEFSIMIPSFEDYVYSCKISPFLPKYYVPIVNNMIDKDQFCKVAKESLKYLTDIMRTKVGTDTISKYLQSGKLNFWDIDIPYNTFNILTIKQVIKNSHENINHMVSNNQDLMNIINLYL